MASPMDDLARAITTGKRFLIASHVNPDGDAIGAMSAMGHLLLGLGKDIALYNASGLPHTLDWVRLPAPIATELAQDGPDWVICLDCGDQHRGGKELTALMAAVPTMVIDHHLDNPRWGRLNWVETNRSSTGEMVGLLAKALGAPLTGPLGEAVYLSIVTDTGNFAYENTSPGCMELAAEIIRQGLNPAVFNEQARNQWSVARIRLWSEALGGLTLHFDGQVGAIRITSGQLARLGAQSADCEGLINNVLRIKGCKIALFLREAGPGVLKLSLRSVSAVNIQPVAASFGGGGHRCAAGGTLQGTIAEMEPKLLHALGKALAG